MVVPVEQPWIVSPLVWFVNWALEDMQVRSPITSELEELDVGIPKA